MAFEDGKIFLKQKIAPDMRGPLVLSFFGINADLLAGLVFSFELDGTVDHCEQCIVSADTYVISGMILGSSLTNEYGTCAYELTVSSLDSQSFRFTFAAVLGTADTLFTCHIYTS